MPTEEEMRAEYEAEIRASYDAEKSAKVLRTDQQYQEPYQAPMEVPDAADAILIGAGKKLTDFGQGITDKYYETRGRLSGEDEFARMAIQGANISNLPSSDWQNKRQEIATQRAADLPYYDALKERRGGALAIGEALPYLATAPLSGGVAAQAAIGGALELSQYGDNYSKALEEGGWSAAGYVAGSTVPRVWRLIKGTAQGAKAGGLRNIRQFLGATDEEARMLSNTPTPKSPTSPWGKQRGAAGFDGDAVTGGKFADTGRYSPDIDPSIPDYNKELLTRSDEIGFKLFPSARHDSIAMEQIEKSAKSMPFLSGMTEEMIKKNQMKLNKLAIESIGEKGTHLTPDIKGRAAKRIGDIYNNLSKGKTVPTYPDNINNLRPDLSQEGEALLDRYFANYPDIEKGSISGEEFNRLRNRISADIRLHNKRPDGVPEDLIQIQRELDKGLIEINPKAGEELRIAGRQWRNLKVLERTNAVGARGNINPRTVAGGLSNSDKTGFARGGNKSDYYDAIRIGQAYPEAVRVAPSGSDTATKLNLLNMVNEPESAIGGALLRKPYREYLESGGGEGARTALGAIKAGDVVKASKAGATTGRASGLFRNEE